MGQLVGIQHLQGWQRFGHRSSEDGRPLLKVVSKTIKDRLSANRHIFMEQPLGSQVLDDEPEMSNVRKVVEDGTLLYIVADGCMVGYKDSVTGLPHKKHSFLIHHIHALC